MTTILPAVMRLLLLVSVSSTVVLLSCSKLKSVSATKSQNNHQHLRHPSTKNNNYYHNSNKRPTTAIRRPRFPKRFLQFSTATTNKDTSSLSYFARWTEDCDKTTTRATTRIKEPNNDVAVVATATVDRNHNNDGSSSSSSTSISRIQSATTQSAATTTTKSSNSNSNGPFQTKMFGRGIELTLFESPPLIRGRGDAGRNNNNNNNNNDHFTFRGGEEYNFDSSSSNDTDEDGDETRNNNNNNVDYGYRSNRGGSNNRRYTRTGYFYDDYDDDDDIMIPTTTSDRSSMRPFVTSSSSSSQKSSSPLSRRKQQSSSLSSLSSSSRRKSLSSRFGSGGGDDNNDDNNSIGRFISRITVTANDWWTTNVAPNIASMPKIVVRCQPTTTLKVRKTFRPLKTVIRLGADFNTQIGVWQFKSSWEDEIIGGKLTLVGRELQVSKSWQVSVGAVEDLVTRLRFRAAINLQTFQAHARVGIRTERLTPINVVDGITILKRIPLDGIRQGNVKLEVKANVALPQPEIEYSTETQRRSLMGMGDVELTIDELNLLLDY